MLTLPEEIRFIWCRPKIRSSIFFLVNRYFALVSNIFGLCIDFLPAVPDEVRLFLYASTQMPVSQLISAEVLTLLIEYTLFLPKA
jgi:hypothetical protein